MEQMLKKRRVSLICWLLLALLQISTSSSAQNTTAPPVKTSVLTPKPVSVAAGEPVVYKCEAPEAAQTLTFTLYSSHGNYSLTCPNGHVEDVLQAISGRCEVNNGEILAVWTLRGASYSNNNTRVFCQQSNYPKAPPAVPHVDTDNGGGYAVLIGCVLGGFFGVMLVFGLLFLLLKKSERFQNCLGVDDTDDDSDTIIKE